MPLKPEDIAALERATLKAVPPPQMKAWRDWLLRMDHGRITVLDLDKLSRFGPD